VRRSRTNSLVIVLALTLSITACARRPVGTQASAPAPPPPSVSSATSVSTPPASSTATPAAPPAAMAPPSPAATPPPPPRPAPPARDFVDNSNVKDVYFDFDKYNIRPDAARTLEENATWLKSNPSVDVLIEGHCDERGTNEYNLALGERRARSTVNYLVSQGIQAGRLTIISYGEERPVCREPNEGCWSRNRRAHFLTRGR
jgi:peptidoglycan-associated lipoprotein